MSELILYTTEDGRSQIRLRADEKTVWLTQMEMAELFDATKQNISLHLKNIFREGELDPVATVKESLTVQTEGPRQVQRPVALYNLDAILAVGYRVRSPRGVQFRRWASSALKEYLLKGFVLDDERLKNPDGRPDYFDEIGLPSNLFYSTGIPVCILVLKKCKKPDDVLFINAAEHFVKGKRQNQLTDAQIDKIIQTYQFRKEEARYSRCVAMDEIEKNGFNLNISRYVSTAVGEAEIDLDAVHAELVAAERAIAEAKDKHNKFLKELGLKPLP
jgi:hypothetical protein